MPQELHVLRCYACKKFQVQIVKKVPKWQCKVCNEKQSVLKVYAKGSGKDCRQYVQDLNMQQGLLMSEEPSVPSLENYEPDISQPNFVSATEQNGSKWTEYLQNVVVENSCDQDSTEERGEDVEVSHMFMRGNAGYRNKASKWNEFLGDKRLNYADEHENSNLESLDAQVPRGKKRKRSHLESCVGEEYTGHYEECQSKPELDSDFSRPSNTTQFITVSEGWNMEKNCSSSKTSAADFKSKAGSKWSQFMESEEDTIPSTAHEAIHNDFNSVDTRHSAINSLCSRKPQSLANSCKSDLLKQKPQDEIFLNGEEPCRDTSVPKHPFHITDDSLDSILDF